MKQHNSLYEKLSPFANERKNVRKINKKIYKICILNNKNYMKIH